MQIYLMVNVLGLLVVNLLLVGSMFNGLGGVVMGGSLYLILIGGVIFDSYIYNINNGNFGGLLGFFLLIDLLVWVVKCLDIVLVDIFCWVVNVVQDYQVLMGDGVFVNGFKEVVIGVNVCYELLKVDVNVVFFGDGVNDFSNLIGVLIVDYVVCMGYLVVVGDSVVGIVNGQILLGVEFIFNQVNLVVLGYCFVVLCGVQVSYSVYGFIVLQVLVGEVLVGMVGGGECQIINFVVGSVNIDVVNVVQLKGVISLIDDVVFVVVIYDLDGLGNLNYCWVMFGVGIGIIIIGNFVVGVVIVGSLEVVNGGQLVVINSVIVSFFGGCVVFDLVSGIFIVLLFEISMIFIGGVIVKGLYENVIDVFVVVDGLLVNFNMQIIDICNGGIKYLWVNLIGIEVVVSGIDVIVVGINVWVMVVNSIVVGVGSLVD